MVGSNGVCDRLKQHRLAGARRSDNQSTLAFAQWSNQVDNSGGKVLLRGFHLQHLFRIQRCEIVKENFLTRLVGRLEVNCFNFDESEITFAFLGWTNLAADSVAGAQIEFSDLRRRDVNVVWPGQIVVFRRAQKTKTIRQRLKHAFGKDQAALL